MKHQSTLCALLLCLALSAGSAVAQEAVPQSNGTQDSQGVPTPGSVPTVQGIPGPQGVPTIPGVPPGRLPFVPVGPNPQGGEAKTVEVEPTPALREALYKQVWQALASEYVDETKLTDWEQRFTKYDGKLNSDKELDAALKELVGAVGDRWTMYKSATDQFALREKLKGGLVPSGIMPHKDEDGKFRIGSLMYGSAAFTSILRERDVILKIDGKSLESLTDDQAFALTLGIPGTKMHVTAVIDGKEQDVELSLFPPLPDRVTVSKLPNDVLYIRLPTFEKPEIVEQFVEQLKRQYFNAKGNLRGLVFDLRNNGGGLFDMALKTSSLFLESGTITKATTHKGQSETVTEHNVRPMPNFAKKMVSEPHMLDFFNWLQNTPMVILINGSTASSSEVTTGALQDNGRAYVIGTHSFGKSVAFTVNDLPNGGRLFMTSLKYLTPAGHELFGKGIKPDLEIERPRGGSDDPALKAAHKYIVELADKRAQQVQDALDISKKPRTELDSVGAPRGFTLTLPERIVFGIGLFVAFLTAIYFVKRK